MRTDVPGVDWLLDCEPRPAQLEALARSYTGIGYRDHKDADPMPFALPHKGHPAAGWGHFMEMRVGKTPTALNEFLLFKRDYGINKCVMWAPNKFKGTWALEAERFGVDVPFFVFDSANRKQAAKFVDTNREYMLFINYEACRQQETIDFLGTVVDDRTYMGYDESVALKNRDSMYFKRIFTLSKDAAINRPMTGKPTPQGVHDLYSQLRLCGALEGWNFFQFRAKFAQMGGFKGKQYKGVQNVERLDRIRRDHSFFARRADWGTVIDNDYETVRVNMTEKQRAAYNTMEEEFMVWLDNGQIVSADQIVTKHMKLQQISSGFVYDEYRHPQWVVPFRDTPKFQDLLERLENQTTDKAIITFHYAPTGDGLIDALRHLNPAIIRGDQYMKRERLNVDAEKKRFNNDTDCRICIAQSDAVKYGHTLMGAPEDPCLTTIFYENSYSLDTRSQVEQRNQGEGQQGAINMVDYVTSDAEAAVIDALQRKEELAARIMGYYKGQR